MRLHFIECHTETDVQLVADKTVIVRWVIAQAVFIGQASIANV